MQAPSPRKKPKFFCSSVIVYANFEKMQELFSIFIAKIMDYFVTKVVAFHYSGVFAEIFFMFQHPFLKKP